MVDGGVRDATIQTTRISVQNHMTKPVTGDLQRVSEAGGRGGA